MKKRITAAILILTLALSLAACGSSKPNWDDVPMPSSNDSSSSDTEPESSDPAEAPEQTPNTNWQKVLYEESVENGLKITVFSDGTLLLEGGDVEENLKNRTVFSDYVPNIKTVKFGDGVTKIGDKTFQGWEKLQNAIIGDDVREIGYSAF